MLCGEPQGQLDAWIQPPVASVRHDLPQRGASLINSLEHLIVFRPEATGHFVRARITRICSRFVSSLSLVRNILL